MNLFAALTTARASLPANTPGRRTLGLACIAHALHDGFTDMIHVLLPIWQAQFMLSYPSSRICGFFGGPLIVYQ